ncbi:MAG: AAA family ATPase [Nostoc sp. ChiSLP01]|nr:AAA family ATPase [Nostoc sp. CmiSLP01]MDZ8287455.1 AAA family ATPase [Nostoc sp. ChiSLP01]
MSNTPIIVNIPGYRIIEELYNGSRTVVYRGYREIDDKPVTIKLLKNPYPSLCELVQFRNQYTIAKNLNSPLIVQIYSLEPYQNGYALVMEDFGGISLKEYFTSVEKRQITSIQEFLAIAIALCNALDILYRERIIHKDIKPSNILINPQTKQVKLIDFSIASLLPRETQTLVNPNVLEGTLAYISPEQTGRMNRGIDYRTDFYSLGVTLYELLTGELPFQANDPMELVHSHIAKLPDKLSSRIEKEIPQILDNIVMKLMAKNAEDRYQSALGLKFDLENCLKQLQETGEIHKFEIAQYDVCDRFIIPDKLYGREAEVLTLLQAFDRVSNGAAEMMLVAGFSGIGKTAVINEVHKPIVRQRGYFIKGKFDQFQRNIPFSAFVQAFRDLMEQLLTESDVQLEQWKNNILEAVGENGQVIIEVIPELSRIIGEQPPAVELSGMAAQNRFNLLFQNFTKVFTSAEHPLVMFLDDLQWADSASLKLMQLLMADTSHLFIIGAYRDNEVQPAHPLMLTLSEIQKNQATINTIILEPLSQVQVNKLVADTLKCPEYLALNLSILLYQKTQGNPFFVTQFFKALHQDGLIKSDVELSCWQCDIAQVTTQAVTDDVVKFMSFQLRKLPPSTQDVLPLAACIGNSFNLATLAIISEQSQVETAAALWKALQSGLIVPIGDVYKFYIGQDRLAITPENQETVTYKFIHDRVQQAAYSLIPDDQKTATHFKIGQLLRENLSELELEEKLFDIVGHLNLGIELITQPEERQALAKLNLQAGVKARNSTAYAAARVYLQTGIELLQTNCWQHQYELTLNLYVTGAEVAYLNGDLEGMEQQAAFVLQQVQTIFDKVKIYEIQIAAQMAQSQVLEAIAIGRNALSQLGVDLPSTPDEAQIGKVLEDLASLEGSKNPSALVNLPRMSDRTAIAAMQLLGVLFAPMLLGMPSLLPLLGATMVKLSLEFGNAPASTVGYALHGMVLCAFLGEVKTGYEFGRLALLLLEKLNAQSMKSVTLDLFGSFIQHHQQALRAVLPTFKNGYTAGIETGDFLYAGYNVAAYACNGLFAGVEVDALSSELIAYNAVLAQMKQESAHIYSDMVLQTLEHLRETVSQPDCLTGTIYDETVMLPKHHQDNDLTSIAIVYTYKLLLAYYFGNYQAALDYIIQGKSYLMAVSGMFFIRIFHFYAALTYLAIYPSQPESEQAQILAVAVTHQTALYQSAQNAPMNHLHKWYLVEAERHRVLGEKAAASECYDQAISLAKEHQFINEEALANEKAAKFYLEWGKQRIAQEYLTEAYYGYARWGAKAKVADLEKRYPQLLAAILQQTRSPLSTYETIFALGSVASTSSTSSSSSVSDSLDLKAILKASQTISGEIELEKLLLSLLSIVIENAGADKCVFMLMLDNRLLIKGSITTGSNPVVLQRIPIEESQDIPHKLIYKVLHNHQTVVLLDATADPTLANDPYIIRQQPKSILCSPILRQGKLLGILYLENNLATGAFSGDGSANAKGERVELLNLLCAQAAISLENARLYEREQEKSQSLQASLEQLQKTEASLAKEREFLKAIVHNIIDGIVVCDASGTLTLFNKATSEFHGLPMESLPSEQWAEYFSLYQRDGQTPLLTTEIPLFRALQGEIVENAEMVVVPKQGSRRILLASGQAIFDPWGNKVGAVVVMRDISERARLEAERKIAELALQQKSQDLQQALLDLQQAQLKIIQSEKMSALGNLVAGVAHEMNNPLGFISASLKQTKPTIADITEHLKLYQETFPNKSEEIEEHAAEIDLEYSLEDLSKVIDSMTMACERLKNISTSLRTFSRADKDYKVLFKIHEGIDSTILILKHRLKANEQRPAIEVVTNYGNLPLIECFPGQLNQVFMNILANAIDALDESIFGRSFEDIKANPNRIIITTSLAEHLVKISIADNGKGMSPEVKSQIFDHLFTTKSVGKGTGLGLAIAKQIVESTHGGKLSCNSVLGEGTEFIIEIPV